MALLPDTVRLRDLPAATWLVSSAFVQRRWNSRLLTILALPMYALILLPAVILGGAYWRDRNGLVLLYRWRPLPDFLIILTAITVVAGIAIAAVTWSLSFAWLFLVGLLWYYAGTVIVLICNGTGTALTVVGPGTPKGQRWVIATLAQRPGTQLSAVLLARDLIAELPRGAVLLAAAANDQLLTRYLRLGFSEGKARRVHRIIP